MVNITKTEVIISVFKMLREGFKKPIITLIMIIADDTIWPLQVKQPQNDSGNETLYTRLKKQRN